MSVQKRTYPGFTSPATVSVFASFDDGKATLADLRELVGAADAEGLPDTTTLYVRASLNMEGKHTAALSLRHNLPKPAPVTDGGTTP